MTSESGTFIHRGDPGPLDGDDMQARPAADSDTVICEIMEIQHTNNAGFVHGGAIMRLVDTAAGIAAARHTHRRVVTVAMDDMSFLSPVYVGDLVTVKAMVNEAFHTSMEIGVRVEVETVPSGLVRHISSAHLVFVAINEAGTPVPVPGVIASTDIEKRRQEQARVRRQQRLVRKAALEAIERGEPA